MVHVMRPDPPGLSLVVSRQEALAAGMTTDEIRHRVRSSTWERLGAGSYLRERLDDSDPFGAARQQHVLQALSAARRVGGSTIAYRSAALVHGLALASGVPQHRELVVPPGSRNGVRAGTRVRLADLGPEDWMVAGGAAVTTPARTWVDVARSSTLADALSVGDSGLRNGLVTPEDLMAALSRHPAQRGLRRADAALPLLSPLRENPLESRSFAAFASWGLPLPECQVEIWDAEGFVARVDFLWRAARLIAEADGRLKYATADDIYAEKRREDRLRADGYGVVRFGWHDLDDALRRRLSHLLRRAA